MEEKYLKILEELGAILIEKDRTIRVQSYEIDNLKNKIEQIEKRIKEEEKKFNK